MTVIDECPMMHAKATTVEAPDRCLLSRLLDSRKATERLIEPLEPEDLCLQGMAEASPPKWHLAHTTWFFETLVLKPHLPGYSGADPCWSFLFNSYYDSIGSRHPRPERGLLTRPAIRDVITWRHHVDRSLHTLLQRPAHGNCKLKPLVELGIQHEQQHQELLLMDLLDGFGRQPTEPVYCNSWDDTADPCSGSEANWLNMEGGLVAIGISGEEDARHRDGHHGDGFHFDNESPWHRTWLEPFQLADQLVSNAEYRNFIADGGYERPELWMSEGWVMRGQRGWQAPRYWRGEGPASAWAWEFSLAGRQPLDPHSPVRHLSWFEADAYARWADARLPTEAEWEIAARLQGQRLAQLHGVLWQWTASPYRPYPGFKAAQGAMGEYNGKFMSGQFVLRGSSFLTPAGHGRDTYRNFFQPGSRWLAAGIRLAR